jgi:hypothetical protein
MSPQWAVIIAGAIVWVTISATIAIGQSVGDRVLPDRLRIGSIDGAGRLRPAALSLFLGPPAVPHCE